MPAPPTSTPIINGRRGRSDWETFTSATWLPKASTGRRAVTTGAASDGPMDSSRPEPCVTSTRMPGSR